MRKREKIIYPYLNDRGGDLSKKWYVEYQFTLPDTPQSIRERVYKGLFGTAQERYEAAAKIIEEKTHWIDCKGYIKPISEYNYLKK